MYVDLSRQILFDVRRGRVTRVLPVSTGGGYTIHGSANVPPRPVSHGCVRIPNYLAPDFFRRMEIGTTVVVD